MQTLKTSIFPKARNEIQVRVNNLEDRFDGVKGSNTYMFDVADFAKEYFMEANQHLLNTLTPEQIAQKMALVSLNITEMNIAGSISLEEMNKSKTKWRTEKTPSE